MSFDPHDDNSKNAAPCLYRDVVNGFIPESRNEQRLGGPGRKKQEMKSRP